MFLAEFEKTAKHTLREITNWIANRAVKKVGLHGQRDLALKTGTELRHGLKEHVKGKGFNVHEVVNILEEPLARKHPSRKHIRDYLRASHRALPEMARKIHEDGK